MLKADIIILPYVLCLPKCHTVLKKNQKNEFENLTKMLMCSYCCDAKERTWIWCCRGHGLLLNVVAAFKYHIWKKYSVHLWLVVTYVIVVHA